MSMEAYYIFIYVVGTCVLLYFSSETKKFLDENPIIQNQDNLDNFKKLARRNMIVVLPYAVFMIVGLALGVMLLMQNTLSGLLVCVVANIVFMVASQKLRKLELRSRELSCTDESLLDEYNRVSTSWRKDLLPKF